MTAMPPTKGHMQLIQFANMLDVDSVEVIVATRPQEPMSYERVTALQVASRALGITNVHNLVGDIPQEPEQAVDFWDMWAGFLTQYGLLPEDYIVSSEPYGLKLAEITGAKFVPYDLDRFIRPGRATLVRDNPVENFDAILPEFQPHMTMHVTIYGAESCGKTTLTKKLASVMNGWELHEWARPYLEAIGPEKLDLEAMHNIGEGQAALQMSSYHLRDRPFIFQDTDLYSTIGYWYLRREWGVTPPELMNNAAHLKSDLYIGCPSNIPFEEDPLRYGGDEREGTDLYWKVIAKDNDLNIKWLTSSDPGGRLIEAMQIVSDYYEENFASKIKFDRQQG